MSDKSWSRKAAEHIWADMCGRSGMDHSDIKAEDPETFEEIMQEWTAIIELARAWPKD